jgi:hypothetical protein
MVVYIKESIFACAAAVSDAKTNSTLDISSVQSGTSVWDDDTMQ